MNDIFCEYLIKHKRSTQDNMKIALYIAAAVFLAIMVPTLVMVYLEGYIALIVVALWGIGMGLYKLIVNLRVEYEYSFTNGYFDVDKIINKNKRKRLLSTRVQEFSFMGKIGDNLEEYNSAFSRRDIKKVAALKADATKESYFALLSIEGEEGILIFDPPAHLVREMKKFNPKKIQADFSDIEE